MKIQKKNVRFDLERQPMRWEDNPEHSLEIRAGERFVSVPFTGGKRINDAEAEKLIAYLRGISDEDVDKLVAKVVAAKTTQDQRVKWDGDRGNLVMEGYLKVLVGNLALFLGGPVALVGGAVKGGCAAYEAASLKHASLKTRALTFMASALELTFLKRVFRAAASGIEAAANQWRVSAAVAELRSKLVEVARKDTKVNAPLLPAPTYLST